MWWFESRIDGLKFLFSFFRFAHIRRRGRKGAKNAKGMEFCAFTQE